MKMVGRLLVGTRIVRVYILYFEILFFFYFYLETKFKKYEQKSSKCRDDNTLLLLVAISQCVRLTGIISPI